jgi:hypothetical protein
VVAAAEEKTSLEPDEFVQTVAGNGIEEKKVPPNDRQCCSMLLDNCVAPGVCSGGRF